MEFPRKKHNLNLQIILMFFLLRILLLFLDINGEVRQIITGLTFIEENNISFVEFFERGSENEIYNQHEYPPLFSLPLYLFILFGSSHFVIKTFFLIFDLISLVFFYKIARHYFKSKNVSNLCSIEYVLCPYLFLFICLYGLNDSIALTYILGSLYFFLRKKYVFSYILIAVGFMHVLLPIFLIFIYIIYLFETKEIKRIISFFPVFISVFLLISLPFLIQYPTSYIQFWLSFLQKANYTISLLDYFPACLTSTILPISIFSLSLNVSILMLIQFIAVITVIVFFLKYFKMNSEKKIFVGIVFILLLIPVITVSFHYRLFLWPLPFLFLILFSEQDPADIKFERKKNLNQLQFLFLLTANIISFFIYLLLYFFSISPYDTTILFFSIVLIVNIIIWDFFMIKKKYEYIFPIILMPTIISSYYLMISLAYIENSLERITLTYVFIVLFYISSFYMYYFLSKKKDNKLTTQ